MIRIPSRPVRWLALLVVLASASCALTDSQLEQMAAVTLALQEQRRASYQLAPGDQIRWTVTPELPGTVGPLGSAVRTDGTMSLAFVGELHVAGLTLEETARQIEAALVEARTVVDPRVVVDLGAVEGELARIPQALVFGEVARPGIVTIPRESSLSRVVGAAGGHLYTGDGDVVRLLRQDRSRKPAVRVVDLDAILRGEEADLEVLDGDIIYVPPSTITRVNRWFSQYVYGWLPFGGYGMGRAMGIPY